MRERKIEKQEEFLEEKRVRRDCDKGEEDKKKKWRTNKKNN